MDLCYNCYTIKEANMKEIKAKYLLVDSENIGYQIPEEIPKYTLF